MNKTEALITVHHAEYAAEVASMCSTFRKRVGMDVEATITFAPGQTRAALEAVERLAESLRVQIADAAERGALDD